MTSKVASYKTSDCTLCDETERQQYEARKASASQPESFAHERFNGEVISGTFEQWATGRMLGEGAFAGVRLAKGLKTGRIVSIGPFGPVSGARFMSTETLADDVYPPFTPFAPFSSFDPSSSTPGRRENDSGKQIGHSHLAFLLEGSIDAGTSACAPRRRSSFGLCSHGQGDSLGPGASTWRRALHLRQLQARVSAGRD